MADDSQHITVSAIAAMAENKVIGKDNALPWHLPADLKHFKQTTMGKPIIMGRRSYESLGKPLPGRMNIVVSRSDKPLTIAATPHFQGMEAVAVDMRQAVPENLMLCHNIEEAIAEAKTAARRDGKDEIFIIGGAQIYEAAMPLTEKFYLTVIHKNYDGDTFLTSFNEKDWATEREEHYDSIDPYPAYTVQTLKRLK
jgi:dihydrofolate reductase